MLDRALKTVREVHQIRQADLAEKLGISKSHLSELESGKKGVSVELLKKYANIFDVPPSTFLSFMEALEGESDRRREKAKKLLRVLEWTLDKTDGEQANK
ncbi:helix-turn-helix transcriptional regulator [Rhodanobacter sp. MP1X3]|uniref:helix-turn-helix domain-containing protein n=1 Tax=Rhodanobacter sp. MP1X3 TaxID=2723086 RepID=UPI001611D9E3|nr:helix-turn-helix transcriptional regulator [Rhodanobacter sp. MP1X3]MBB6241251.1 transcriptional regulator with XRE-family HTH domain [Rhodanobacter sp. MP1X3]